MIDTGRLDRLEAALGCPVPASYRRFLEEHRWARLEPEWVVAGNPDYWGLQGLFELGSGPGYAQVDAAYRLTEDVLPGGLLPVGEDGAGNLYLMDCRDKAGPILWWDHEKPAGADGLEFVAASFPAFLADIAPEG